MKYMALEKKISLPNNKKTEKLIKGEKSNKKVSNGKHRIKKEKYAKVCNAKIYTLWYSFCVNFYVWWTNYSWTDFLEINNI